MVLLFDRFTYPSLTRKSSPFLIKPVQVMRESGFPKIFAVALNIIPAPTIIASRLFFKSFYNRARISDSRLAASVEISL